MVKAVRGSWQWKIERLNYVKQLIEELRVTESVDAYRQILANLANFAYDPINYKFLLDLNIIDEFISCLLSGDQMTVELAIGGICNLSITEEFHELICTKALDAVKSCLCSPNVETVSSALTILFYISRTRSRKNLLYDILPTLRSLHSSSNVRLKNLSDLLLND